MASNRSTLFVDIKARDQVTPTVKTIQSSIIRFVGAITASLVAVRGVAFPVQQAAEFEKELKNVQKTTNFSAIQIKGLSASLNEMSKGLVASQVELAQIAGTAGQLGLGSQGVQAIESFTESVARATLTFGIGAEALSTYAAQILNVFKIPTGDLENVFSAINEVSNNSVASAEKLIDIIKRVGNVAGLTVNEVAALAAQSQDLGVSSEVAGTTLVKQFSNMQAKAKDFAKVMSITTQEWVARVEGDALQAFRDILTQLGKLDTEARASAIRDLFGGGRIFALASKQVADAAGGFELLDKSLENATNAFSEGTSSIREYDVVASSLEGRWENLKNVFNAVSVDIGNKLIPVLKDVVVRIKEFLDSPAAEGFFDSLGDALLRGVEAIKSFGATLADLEIVWRNILPIIKTFLVLGFGKAFIRFGLNVGAFVARMASLTAETQKATAAFLGLKSAGATLGNSGLAGISRSTALADARRNFGGAAAESSQAAKTAAAEAKAAKDRLAAVATEQELKKRGYQATRKALLEEQAISQAILNRSQINTATRTKHSKIVSNINAKLALNLKEQKSIAATQAIIVKKRNEEWRAAAATLAVSKSQLKTDLQRLTTAKAQARQSLGGLGNTSRILGSKAGQATLLASAKKLGAQLIKAVLGISGWLIAASLLWSALGDSIKAFAAEYLGFTFDLKEDEQARIDRKNKKAIKDKAEALADTYEDTITKRKGIELEIEAIRFAGAADAEVEAKKLAGDLAGALEDELKAVGGALEYNKLLLEQWAPALNDAEVAAFRLREQLAIEQNQLRRLEGVEGRGAGAANAAIPAQLLKIEAIQKRLAVATQDQEFSAMRLARYEKEILDATRERGLILDTLTNTGNDVFPVNLSTEAATAVIDDSKLQTIADAVLKLQAARNSLAEQIKTVEDNYNPDSDTDVEQLRKLNKEFAVAEIVLSNYREEQERLAKVAEASRKVVTDAGGANADFVAEAVQQKAIVKELIARRAAQVKANGATKAQSALYKEALPTLGAVTQQLLKFDARLQSLAKNNALLTSLGKTLTGLADNVTSVVAAADRDLRRLQRLADGGDDSVRQSNLEEQLRTDYSLRSLNERTAKRIAEYDEKSAKALARGNESEARRYQRLAEDEKVRAGYIETQKKGLIEAASLQESILSKSKDLESSSAALVKLKRDEQAALLELQRLESTQGVPQAELDEARRASEEIASQYLNLADATKESDVELRKLLGDLINVGNTPVLKDGLTLSGGLGTLSDSLDLQPIIDKSKELSRGFNEQYAVIVKTGASAVQAQLNQMDQLSKKFAELKKEAVIPVVLDFSTAQLGELDGLVSELNKLKLDLANEEDIGKARAAIEQFLVGIQQRSENIVPFRVPVQLLPIEEQEVTRVIDEVTQGLSPDDGVIAQLKVVSEPYVFPSALRKLEEEAENAKIDVPLNPTVKSPDLQKELDRLIEENGGSRAKNVPLGIDNDFLRSSANEAEGVIDELASTEVNVPVGVEVPNASEVNQQVAQLDVDSPEATLDATLDQDSLNENVESSFKQIPDQIVNVIANIVGTQGGGNASVTAATGGYIRGPGTTKSDSIPAWLSDKEYVVQAQAVSHYGVDFIRAINQMKFQMPKFNTGGYVQAQPQNYGVGLYDKLNSDIFRMPKFANGGLVNAATGAASAASAANETTVKIEMGGHRSTLRGEKEQVRNLVEMMNNIEAVR